MKVSRLPLRIGVIGAGFIARQFVRDVAGSEFLTVSAVASRSAERAQTYAKETGVGRAFGSYEALLADADVDAIYNALPNGLHAHWAIRAAEAGKHILCEKPLAASEDEAKAMYAAARRNNVHLVEAYPYLAQPMTLEARKLVDSGAIGRVRLICASFSVPFSDASNIRLQSDLAGGATMDAGSYAASFVRVMAGERPTRVSAVARWGDTGVDITLMGTFEFASGLLAQVTASFVGGYHRHAEVIGDGGSIDTRYLNHPPIGGPAEFQIRRGPAGAAPIETIPVAEGSGFLAEANSFAQLVSSNDPARWTGVTETESIDVAAMLAALLRSAREERPVEI